MGITAQKDKMLNRILLTLYDYKRNAIFKPPILGVKRSSFLYNTMNIDRLCEAAKLSKIEE